VASFEQATEILERLELYRAHPNFGPANGPANAPRDAAIIGAIGIGSVDQARTVLDQIRNALVPAVGGAVPAAGWTAEAFARLQLEIESVWNIFVQYLARPLLKVILLIMLIYIGLSTLYVDGSATFGVRPLVELFALFAWGLSADVASRSLANLRGSGQ
jgi:hypothetical protein